MKHITIQETIDNPCENIGVQPVVFNRKDAARVLTMATYHTTIIDESTLKGFDIVLDEDGLPKLDSINGYFGVLTRRKVKSDTMAYEYGMILSPYGSPNGQLWVKEVWRIGAWRKDLGQFAIDYKASPEFTNTPWLTPNPNTDFNTYLASITEELAHQGISTDSTAPRAWRAGQAPLKWQSPDDMPEWASRLMLDVSKVAIVPSKNPALGKWKFLVSFSLNNWNFASKSSF